VKIALSNLDVDEPRRHGEALTTNDRLIAAWEIVSVITSFLLAEWLIRPFGPRYNPLVGAPLVVALIVMVLSHYARGENLQTIGWRIDNFWRALRSLLLPTLVAMIVIGILGWVLGGFSSNKWREWRWLLWLPMWGFIQQYALQGFINRRAQIALGTGYWSILLVASIFAVLHLPNLWLAVGTFIVARPGFIDDGCGVTNRCAPGTKSWHQVFCLNSVTFAKTFGRREPLSFREAKLHRVLAKFVTPIGIMSLINKLDAEVSETL
jgi:hypothetical protein